MHSLRKPLFYSALTHFIVFCFVILFPSLSLRDHRKVIWVELPRGRSEAIDLKMKEAEQLPKSTIQEQKKALLEKEKTKEKIKDKTKMAAPKPKTKAKEKKLTPEEKKIQDALAKIDTRLRNKPVEPEAAQLKDKGEGFKYGTGTEALRVPPSDPEYIGYQAKVRAKIMEEWILPPIYLEGLKARIAVMMNDHGEVTATEWDEKSGNESFDSSCLRAVQRASPLPMPPERLKWEAYNEGFLVEFDRTLKGE